MSAGDGESVRALLDTIAAGTTGTSGRATLQRIRDALTPSPAASGEPAPAPGVHALADRVRSGLLARTGFPPRLSDLATLPTADARALLTDLVAALLTADAPRPVVTTATERLSRVVAAVNGSGRQVTAAAPPLPLPARPAGSAEWRGGVLALLAPGTVLRLALPQLTSDVSGVRRTALSRLAVVAPRLGRPPLPLPAPNAPDDVYVRLWDLLEPDVLGEHRVVRGRPVAPPWPPQPVGNGGAPPSEAAAESPAPARSAYARLDAPDVVAPGAVFELRVGLAPQPTAGVVQDAPFAVPVAAFTLDVTVIAPGFRLLGGEPWHRSMAASPDDPHPYHVLRVVALDGFADDRSLTAAYTVDGRVLGYATRVIRVGAPDAHPAPEPAAGPGTVWVLPADDAERPDLEIVVARGNDVARSALTWLVRSRHPGLVAGPGMYSGNLDRPEDGAKEFVRGVEDRKAADDLGEYLDGFSLRIGQAVPDGVWAALRAAAAAVAGPPTVLLASWEPYVPWELADVPDRWDRDAPALLGAQTVLGRWTYGQRLRAAGPPAVLELTTMGVVTGRYEASNLRLPQAEQEADHVRSTYAATTVDARIRPILDCLAAEPTVDALHFALHGSGGAAQGTNEGLRLSDRTWLGSLSIEGVGKKLEGRASGVRTVFLNACQLGQGRALFGEYAGMAAAFVGLGVGAVTAPLWKVDDTVAREVAQDFYAAVFRARDGVRPAEQLRRERVATAGREGSPAGTRLAYVYFGHPCLRVIWSGRRGGDDA